MTFMSSILTPDDEHLILGDLAIGIDPGKSTGFAIYSKMKRELMFLETLNFWGAYSQVLSFEPTEVSCIYVECPDNKHIWQQTPKDLKAIQRQGVNVGSVLRESELMAEGLVRAGYKVRKMNPRKKRTHEEFQRFTGWPSQTNQHCRDAALLCWGR